MDFNLMVEITPRYDQGACHDIDISARQLFLDLCRVWKWYFCSLSAFAPSAGLARGYIA